MKQTTFDLFKKILAVLKPLPNITLSEWADRYCYIARGTSAEPGRWRTSRAPYQREIMDAITDNNTFKVVVMSSAQVGKTVAFILNAIGYYMHYDPCPIMVLQPTIKMAEGFSKEKLTPMLRATPVLQEKVNEKSRSSGNTILQKLFPGGHITIVGANSPASLASRPIRILFADEVDRYPATAGKEGDPLLLASKRTTTFWNRKEVYVSTPTVKGVSRIAVEYEHSTQERWNVPCPVCGEYQPLVWRNGISYDKENLIDVNYICCKCGVLSCETDWKNQFPKGKFVALFPDRKVRGFHLNSLASPFVEWKELAEKFIKANEESKKGNVELLKTFINTELGECWEDEGSQLEWDQLYNRRELYSCEVPHDVICLTAGIDTQDNRFEIEVVGWGADGECWGITYQVLYGDLSKQDIWNRLDLFLLQTFEREDGAKLKILSACIDSGGHFTDGVYRFCKDRWHRSVYAIKGGSRNDIPYVGKPSTSNRVKVPLFVLGVNTGKSLLYNKLKVEIPGPGFCHFPLEENKGYSMDYFKGLTSERRTTKYKNGRVQYVWEIKEKGLRNEPLDCRVYASAALEIANPVLKKYDANMPIIKKRGRRIRSEGVV